MSNYSRFAYREIPGIFVMEDSCMKRLLSYQLEVTRANSYIFKLIMQEFKNYPDAFKQTQAVAMNVCYMIAFAQLKIDVDVKNQYVNYVLSGKCVFDAIEIRKKIYGVC